MRDQDHQKTTEEITAAEQEGSPRLSRRALGFGALVGIAAISVGGFANAAADRSRLEEQQLRIQELEQELRTQTAVSDGRVDDDVTASLGIDRSRLAPDAEILAALMEQALTWDSGESYEQARTELITDYDLTEGEPFLTDFMPPSRFNEDSNGNRFYYLDTIGANSALHGEVEVELVSAMADKYRYLAWCDIAVTSDAVDAGDSDAALVSELRRMMLMATIDAEGTVLDLEGVSAGDSTLTTG